MASTVFDEMHPIIIVDMDKIKHVFIYFVLIVTIQYFINLKFLK